MKLYDLELSGHAHRARLMAALLNLDIEIIPVDLLNGAHKQPEFLSKNPFGQVPALEDGDVSLYDSNAILVYLASKYDVTGQWLPTTPTLAAEVQIWLSKAANELALGPARARLVEVFNAPYDIPELLEKSEALLSIMESHLKGRSWFVGAQPTIADVALYSYTAHAPEGGVDLSQYPNILAWIRRVESLAGFVPMTKTETEAKLKLSA